MWSIIEKITDQVSKFGTFFGQLWYVLVFVLRLIVVVTLGGAVYGDEQASFKCGRKSEECTSICYNQFAKVSHLRFWAFQLLAVTFPTLMFHFYSLYITAQIEKIHDLEKAVGLDGQEKNQVVEIDGKERELKKISRKKKTVGKVRKKQVFSGGELTEIDVTNKIYIAYYVTTIFKLAIEATFMYLGYTLYYIQDVRCEFPNALPGHETDPQCDNSLVDHILMNTVPTTYVCRDDKADFRTACATSLVIGPNIAAVPCFPSRPFEKTIFLRYMNILSFVCLLLCVLDLIYMPARFLLRRVFNRRLTKPSKEMKTVYVYRNGPPDSQWASEETTPGDGVVTRRTITYSESKG